MNEVNNILILLNQKEVWTKYTKHFINRRCFLTSEKKMNIVKSRFSHINKSEHHIIMLINILVNWTFKKSSEICVYNHLHIFSFQRPNTYKIRFLMKITFKWVYLICNNNNKPLVSSNQITFHWYLRGSRSSTGNLSLTSCRTRVYATGGYYLLASQGIHYQIPKTLWDWVKQIGKII